MTNVSAVEKMAELMQQMEENSPRVAALQYCLKQVAEKAEEADKRNAELVARCAALAAENAGLKSKGRELLGEACAVYAKFNKLIDPAIGDFIDGQTLHEFQYVLDCETQATDAFLAEVRESVVNGAIEELNQLVERSEKEAPIAADHYRSAALYLKLFADQHRKGVQS
ncbi:TPA: hypothetical protein QH537_002363 [Enterobacter hormaechei subsp. steigerwaltii]|nr:hypothetical protein [Enterobacter hormaechei subsp. steigerwaltii]HDT0961863.1 hypothetical protein [Enterobacter hormaechei subsp. steigerwaltii]